jgi:hypothetical protein
VGARFEGTNRVFDAATETELIWIRPCTVTAVQPPEEFSYTVGDRYDGSPATEWDVLIEPSQAGCRVSQRFRHLRRGLSGIRHMADEDLTSADTIVNDRKRDLLDGINHTFQAMKEVAAESFDLVHERPVIVNAPSVSICWRRWSHLPPPVASSRLRTSTMSRGSASPLTSRERRCSAYSMRRFAQAAATRSSGAAFRRCCAKWGSSMCKCTFKPSCRSPANTAEPTLSRSSSRSATR